MKHILDGQEIDISKSFEHKGTRFDPPHHESRLKELGVQEVGDDWGTTVAEEGAGDTQPGDGDKNPEADNGDESTDANGDMPVVLVAEVESGATDSTSPVDESAITEGDSSVSHGSTDAVAADPSDATAA